MKISKKVLSTVLSLMVIFGAFAATQVVSARASTNYDVTLRALGRNHCVLAGNKVTGIASSDITLSNDKNCTVNHIDAWVVTNRGREVAIKRQVNKGKKVTLTYKNGKIPENKNLHIMIEQNNVEKKRAIGTADLW